jgi:CheY-like chemotaxis protein
MIPLPPEFTVLYVEDEENDVILFQHAWQEAGIQQRLEIAKTGKDALNYFQRHGTPDRRVEFTACGLLFLDLNLPLVSGFDILSSLRKHDRFKRLPVLIFSSSNQVHDIQRAYEIGANAFLIKPSSLDALIELLRSVKDFWLLHNAFPHCGV